jgi:hypothetical protein
MLCCIFEHFFETQCGYIIFIMIMVFLINIKVFQNNCFHFFNKLYFVYCVIFGSSRVVAFLVVKI